MLFIVFMYYMTFINGGRTYLHYLAFLARAAIFRIFLIATDSLKNNQQFFKTFLQSRIFFHFFLPWTKKSKKKCSMIVRNFLHFLTVQVSTYMKSHAHRLQTAEIGYVIYIQLEMLLDHQLYA